MELHSGFKLKGNIEMNGYQIVGALAVSGDGINLSVLDIYNVGAGSYISTTSYRNDANSGGIFVRKARGTRATPTATVSGDVVGNVYFEGYDGANFQKVGAFVFRSKNAISPTASEGEMFLQITPIGSVSPANIMFADNTRFEFYRQLTVTGSVDARGYTVNADKLQTVNSAGSIGGYLQREASDVQAYYHNRQALNTLDVARFYVKNNTTGVQTQVGSFTGNTDSVFSWTNIKSNGYMQVLGALDHDGTTVGFFGVTPTTRPTALTSGDAGVVNSGDLVTDGVINNLRIRQNEMEAKLQALGLFQ